MVKVSFEVTKKWGVFFLVAVLFFGLGLVVAYTVDGSGGPPNVIGHSAEELEGVCLSDGTNCPASLSQSEFGPMPVVRGLGINGEHGMANVFGAQVWLNNTIPEEGYSVGDMVLYSASGNQGNSGGGQLHSGINLKFNNTHFNLKVASSGLWVVAPPSDDGQRQLTDANWEIIIRTWGS